MSGHIQVERRYRAEIGSGFGLPRDKKEVDGVEHVSTAAAVIAAAAAIIRSLAAAWVRCCRIREQARAERVRHLPPDSRMWDLGEHGLFVEVGGECDRGERADGS